jgi:DNA-binding transcriptional LysR family regulator
MVARGSTEAATVFDDLRQGVRNIEFPSDPTLGEIKIGGNEAFIAGLLSTVLRRLRARYPGITIHLKSGNALLTSVGTLPSELRSSDCYIAVTTLIRPFVRFYDTTIRRYRLVHVWAARKTSVALSAARLGDILIKPVGANF